MHSPPNPKMRSPAAANGRAKSQENIHTEDSSLAAFDFQAQKLRRLFSLCQATACTVAHLAFAVSR